MRTMKLWEVRGWLLKLFVLWLSSLLVIHHQSMSAAASPEGESRFSSEVYSGLLMNCQDRLEAWGAVSPSVSNASTSEESHLYASSGAFMRGRWWRQRGGGGKVSSSNAEFFQGSDGKFDFFSSGINASRGGIQNFSASIFILNAKEGPRGPILEASGLLNVETGEVCLVGCSRTLLTELKATSSGRSTNISTMVPAESPVDDQAEALSQEGERDCSIRGSMNFVGEKDDHHLRMEGTLESMRNSSEPGWFAPVRMSGKIVNDVDQRALYQQEVIVNSALYLIEAVIIVWQIVYTIKVSSGYFVSVLAILVQIAVQSLTAARVLYIPLRLLTYRAFKYLFTTLSLIPCFLILLLILINFLFLSLVLRKRRMAKRSNILDRPHELRLASVCVILYGIIGGLLWSLENFSTYLQVVWCWFLLPQVIANVFWDLRAKPLHPLYSVGLSLCRIIFIGYDSLRPTIYGYDDVNDFPQGWFWGITLPVMLLLVYCFLQQWYGGRCFLPQRWFGYHELPHSNSQATQQEFVSKLEDRMVSL